MQRIRQRTQAHRTGACHDDQLAALFNTHFVVINTYLGVISGVKHRPSSSSSPQETPRSKRGLQRELHARIEFILMPRANLDDIARELVPQDGRMLSYIGMHALVRLCSVPRMAHL